MNLNQQNGWIAVSDRLPELDTPVWVRYPNEKGSWEYGIYTRKKADDGWPFVAVSSDIVYWQPLPEPPTL